MSERANPTIIGAFVLGAVALLVAAVLAFGGRSILEDPERVVCYFAGSLKGLEVGSPVRYRGVQLGRVSSIKASFDPQRLQPEIPVYLELDLDAMLGGVEDPSEVDWQTIHDRHVAAGLRAQLALDNVITGTLFVALDYLPDTDVRLRGGGEVPEIPTVQSNLEQLVETLQEIPFKQVFEQAAELVEKLDQLVADDARRALAAIEGSMTSVDTRVVDVAVKLEAFLDQGRELVASIEAQIEPLSSSTQGFFDDGRGLVNGLDGRVDELAGLLEQALEEVRGAVRSIDTRVAGLADRADGLVDSADATLGNELSSLLVELERSARSVRTLAEALERRPEMLIGGKK